MKLGMLDSGLGGICVLKTLHDVHNNQDILCLADQHNAPYGNRSSNDIIEITRKNVDWFVQQDIRRLFFACNTTSSVALPVLVNAYQDMEFINIIELTCRQLLETTYEKILVLATTATVKSHAYTNEIHRYLPNAVVDELPLSELAGYLENDAVPSVVDDYLEDQLADKYGMYDLVVLGCTHYPLVRQQITACLGCNVIDTNSALVDYFSADTNGDGMVEIVTTGDAEHLKKQTERLLQWRPTINHVII